MEDKCPFCGARQSPRCNGSFIEFDCQTYQAHEGTGEPYWDRQRPCFERQIATLQIQLADLQEVLEDKRRLTRELDIALSGEKDAAQQAALCDLIPAAKQLRAQLAAAEARVEGMREVLEKVAEGLMWPSMIEEAQALLTPAAGEWVAVRRELWKEALTLVAEHPGTLTPGYWKDRINKFFAEVDKAALAGGKE